jgi:hypothetical protein
MKYGSRSIEESTYTKGYCYFAAVSVHLYVDLRQQKQAVVVRDGCPSTTSSAVIMSSGAAMLARARVIDIIRFVTCTLTRSFFPSC